MTFKQLEALHWIVKLGSFLQAAAKLHTTQSAISKRIQELEDYFETELFDRNRRTARLTEKGEELLLQAERLLAHRDQVIEAFSRSEVLERRISLGVTEMTALTWLPQFVDKIQQFYPRAIVESDVDHSVNLRDKLLADKVDLVIVPHIFHESLFRVTPLSKVDNAWMCKPGLIKHGRAPISMHELAKFPLLIQGNRSGSGLLHGRWLDDLGIKPVNHIDSNSLIAMIGLTISGLGVSGLPKQCMTQLIESGMLEIIHTRPALPAIPFVAVCKAEAHSALLTSITNIAKECCDFSKLFQAKRGDTSGQITRSSVARHQTR